MQSENRLTKSKLLYIGLYEETAMSSRYNVILFDKYSPEKFKMFFDAKIRMIPRDVSINMRNESEKD